MSKTLSAESCSKTGWQCIKSLRISQNTSIQSRSIHMGLQKWSTKTDTQLAPTCDECGASARDMLVHCVGWPVGVSEDLRAKLQVLGDTEAAWGSRSSTGRLNWRPWGPHITRGLSRVSPAKFLGSSIMLLSFLRKMCLQMKSAIREKIYIFEIKAGYKQCMIS